MVHYLYMDNRTDPQYKLRMPPELRDKLKELAKENHRTMNAEMVARLQESFERASGVGEEAAITKLQRKIERQEEMLTEAMRILRSMSRQGASPSSEKEENNDS